VTRDGQIRICNEGPEPSAGQIVICDPAPEPSEGKIVICPPKCGPDIPALVISGTETPSVGSQYSASGGKPPYRFSISAGQIALGTGVVTDLSGVCGSGSVSVADACGNMSRVDVRFPTGTWVLVADEDFTGDGCGDWSWSSSQIHELNCTVGKHKYWERTQKHSGPDCACFSHSCPSPVCPPTDCCLTVWQRKTYEWKCP